MTSALSNFVPKPSKEREEEEREREREREKEKEGERERERTVDIESMAAGKQGGTRGKEARRQGGKGKLGKHAAPCIATPFATLHSQRARSKIEN